MSVIPSGSRSVTLCWMLPSNNCIQPGSSSELKALLQSNFFLSFFPGRGAQKKNKEKACLGVLENFISVQCRTAGVPGAAVTAFPGPSAGGCPPPVRPFPPQEQRDGPRASSVCGGHRPRSGPAPPQPPERCGRAAGPCWHRRPAAGSGGASGPAWGCRGPGGPASPLPSPAAREGEWQPGIESDPLSRLLRGLGCLMPRSNESLNRRDNFLHMGKRARTRRQSPELACLRLFFTFYRQLQGGGKIEGEEENQKDHVVKQVGGFDRRSEKAAGAPGGEAAGAALRPAEGSGRGRGRPGAGSLPTAAGKGRRGQAGAWLSA